MKVNDVDNTDTGVKSIVKKIFSSEKKIEKVLLIQPPDSDKKIFNYLAAKRGRLWNYPPYGLGVLSTQLRDIDIKPEILNLNNEILKAVKENNSSENFDFDKIWQSQLVSKIKEFKPDFIGVTSMFSQSHEITKQLTEFLSNNFSEIPVGAGGVHITNSIIDEKTFEKFVKDFKNVKYFFLYEADLSFIEFVKSYNSIDDNYNIGQLVIRLPEIFKKKNKFTYDFIFFKNRLHPTSEDINKIPAHDLMETSNVSRFGTIGSFFCLTPAETKISTVLSNRGCRAQCTFCSVRNFNGVGVRRRSTDSVIEELKILHFDYGINHIMWLDDDFLYNPAESIKLFEGILKNKINITWDCSNGVIAAACKDEVIAAAEKSGCIGVNIGMESGNREILKNVRKPGTVENFLKAAEVFRKYQKINARVFLMIGFPNESYRQILDTINVSKEMNLDWYNVSILEPLPNTPIFNSMVAEGLIDVENLKFSDIRYNSGGLGKHKQQKRDMLSSDFSSAFNVDNIDSIPPKEKLDDIWAYMNFHLNFKRLTINSNPEKILQKKLYVKNITDLISPENCLALYFLGYLEKKMYGYASEKTINNLRNTLDQHQYWIKRFDEFNLKVEDLTSNKVTVKSIENRVGV